MSSTAVRRHQTEADTQVEHVLEEDPEDRQTRKTPRIRQRAAAHALFVQTWAAKEAAGWLE
ncbi:hypothetical protein GCM10023238_17090 [Streptomyces heliomycini]